MEKNRKRRKRERKKEIEDERKSFGSTPTTK